MDYRKARIVLFSYQFGIEVTADHGNKKASGWMIIPPFSLNRIKLYSENGKVNIKQEGIERELLILPYLKGHYESLLSKDSEWLDATNRFVDDIEKMLEVSDAVVWILASPASIAKIESYLYRITTNICRYDAIENDSQYAIVNFPLQMSA